MISSVHCGNVKLPSV